MSTGRIASSLTAAPTRVGCGCHRPRVDRVLARHGLALQGDPHPARTHKTPWPHRCEWRPNQLWCWDSSQFERCMAARYGYAIVDLVSRKWIATHLTTNPDSVAARILFSRGLDNEELLTDELRDRLAATSVELPDDDTAVPLLLAISDNGTEMRSNDTHRFIALCSIAQHFRRPSTPTDQAWITVTRRTTSPTDITAAGDHDRLTCVPVDTMRMPFAVRGRRRLILDRPHDRRRRRHLTVVRARHETTSRRAPIRRTAPGRSPRPGADPSEPM